MLKKLEAHIQSTGMSQTEIVVSALANYLGSAENIPIIDRLVALEKRFAVLEAERSQTRSD